MNAVGPGIVKPPMVAEMIATQEGRDGLAKVVPIQYFAVTISGKRLN